MGETLSDDEAERCWSVTSRHVLHQYHELMQESDFVPLSHVFTRAFTFIFAELDIDADPVRGADIFIRQHGMAQPFSDTSAFLDHVALHYKVCVVTDSDEEMLSDRLRGLGKFDRIFSSGSLGAYKTDRQNRLFRAVLTHFGVPPERILHIGDSHADVIGANRAGIKTCWLNRAGNHWSHDVLPDYSVSSLGDLMRIL
ncbi:MAG: HAD family hydrolase [bacterium]